MTVDLGPYLELMIVMIVMIITILKMTIPISTLNAWLPALMGACVITECIPGLALERHS